MRPPPSETGPRPPSDPLLSPLNAALWREAPLPAIAWKLDDGLIVAVNPAAERLLGRAATELVGTPAQAWARPEGDGWVVTSSDGRRLAGAALPLPPEVAGLTLLLLVHPAGASPPHPLALAVADTAVDIVFAFDHQGVLQYANRLPDGGASTDQAVGRTWQSLLAPEAQPGMADLIDRAWDSEGPLEAEVPGLLPGAARTLHLVRLAPISQGGRKVGMACWLRDVTQQRLAERHSRDLETHLVAAQRLESLGALAGGIAHQFNNLLTAIVGYAELIGWRLPPGALARSYLQQIHQAARRAADLSRQMLIFSGRAPLQTARVNVAELVAQVAPLVDGALPPGARLERQVEEVPPVTADPDQLRQVLLNLMTNAAEALEGRPGQVDVRVSRRVVAEAEVTGVGEPEPLAAGEYVQIEVRDNGAGMAEATMERMFEPFFSTRMVGRGLGLAAVLGIVRAHGGAVEVTSAVGVGSTFRVSLPVPATATAP